MTSHRIVRYFLVGVVLVLALGWLWSSTYHAGIRYRYRGCVISIVSRHGVIGLALAHFPGPDGWRGHCRPLDGMHFWPSESLWPLMQFYLGFGFANVRDPADPAFAAWEFAVPYWFLIAFVSLLLFWGWRVTKQKVNSNVAFPIEQVTFNTKTFDAGNNTEELK